MPVRQGGIVPVIISQSHVIGPIIDKGETVTYVVYERIRPNRDGSSEPRSEAHWLSPSTWFRGKSATAAGKAAPESIYPRPRTTLFGAKQRRRVAEDIRFFRKVVTPMSDGRKVQAEKDARKLLVFRSDGPDTEEAPDPVTLDEIQAKATGGGYLYPFAASEERLDAAGLDNLSSRAIQPDLWKLAARGPNKNVRHIVGRGDEPIRKAMVRGKVLLKLMLKKGMPGPPGTPAN